MTYRKYINIVEAANKGCPIATTNNDDVVASVSWQEHG